MGYIKKTHIKSIYSFMDYIKEDPYHQIHIKLYMAHIKLYIISGQNLNKFYMDNVSGPYMADIWNLYLAHI